MSGNIYLIANKNVTVSCFPRLCNITLMSVPSSDKWMQEGKSAAQHSLGPGRAAQLPLPLLLLLQLPQGLAPKALFAPPLWLPQPPPPTLPIIPMRHIQLGWSFSGPLHPFPELPHGDVPAPHCPVCKLIPFQIQPHSQGTHSPDLGGHEQPHTSCLSHSHIW